MQYANQHAGTPYLLDAEGERALAEKRIDIEQRIERLRAAGTLTTATLQSYYGRTRFAATQRGYPPWLKLDSGGPGGEEIMLLGDMWQVLRDGQHREFAISELAAASVHDLASG